MNTLKGDKNKGRNTKRQKNTGRQAGRNKLKGDKYTGRQKQSTNAEVHKIKQNKNRTFHGARAYLRN